MVVKLAQLMLKIMPINYSRKNIDQLAEFVAVYGAKGLAWMKVEDEVVSWSYCEVFH